MLEKGKYYSLDEIIGSVVDDFDFGDEFCIYGDSLPLKGGKTYLIDDFPGVDENDQEIILILSEREGLTTCTRASSLLML